MRSTCPYHDRCILDANTSSHIAGGRDRSLTGRHHKWAGQVSHRQASQVGGAGVSQADIAGGWGRSLTGRHHRKWVGQVFHGQASSQVGGVGLTGRHHHKRAGQVSHRQASSQVGGAGIIAGGWGRSLTGRLFSKF